MSRTHQDLNQPVTSRTLEHHLLKESKKSMHRPPSNWTNHLEAYARRLAGEKDRQVCLTISGETLIPESIRDPLTDILIQLISNAVIHGLESPAQRAKAEKPICGEIKIVIQNRSDQTSHIIFNDDGRGISLEKIRKTAIAQGLGNEKSLESLNNQQILDLISTSGFSTAEQTDQHSGRGIGMDIVSHLVTKELGGRLTLRSVPGESTEFEIQLSGLNHH